MYSVKEISALVNKTIVRRKFPETPAELYDPLRYLMQLEGKRFRPCLLLLAMNLFSDEIDSALDQALGVEYFHTFTLIHDDIMDKAPLRRGMPTVHEKWNNNIAILSGDVMFVEALTLMSTCSAPYLQPVLQAFNKMAREVCEGQQLDMNFENRASVSIDEYLEMTTLKTAVLLGCSLQIGAILGDADPAQALHLYHFGKNMGLAFQLRDDLLDVYGSPDVFGKRVGGDIIANKKTFLLLRALELATGERLEQLQFWINSTDYDPEAKIAAVVEIYNSLKIQDLSAETIEFFSAQALIHLDALNVPADKKEILAQFCAEFMKRQS